MHSQFTRRTLLVGAASLAAASTLVRASALATDSSFAFVGGYTSPAGNADGILCFRYHPQTGELTDKRIAAHCSNPSWLVTNQNRSVLYAVDESNRGMISAYSIAAASGELSLLNTVTSGGAGPAHMSLTRDGKYALVANYASGNFAVLPIAADGSLASATDIAHGEGTPGAQHASSAPAGSFAISGHDASHAHMIAEDPSGAFVLVCDLGLDAIFTYRLDRTSGKLTTASTTHVPSGDGPRHLVFHPNGRWLYVICEESSTVVLFHFDQQQGTLRYVDTHATLAAGFSGTSFASEIRMDMHGRFVYAANRLADSIAVFAVGSEGKLTRTAEISTHGSYPNQITFDRAQKFLFACNRRSDAVTCFRVDEKSGELGFTGQFTAAGSPSSIVFV